MAEGNILLGPGKIGDGEAFVVEDLQKSHGSIPVLDVRLSAGVLRCEVKTVPFGDKVGNAPGAFLLHSRGSVAGTSRFLGIFDSGGE